MNNQFDVIVVGSGVSGLTCASLLAQLENKRVLVLERHFTVGGFTHSFKRKEGYEWDVGVHYVGEMNPGSHYRALFDRVTAGGVSWKAMPEVFDRFVYPGLNFGARCGIQRFRQDLIDSFPHQSSELEQYFDDLISAARWYGRLMVARLLPDWMRLLGTLFTFPGRGLGLMTTRDYLDRHFNDNKLKGVLASQWGNAGLPPGQSAFAVHAVIACHYLDGGYYPVGGAKQIAESIVPIVEASDGKVYSGYRVEKILLDGDTAIGVQAVTRAQGRDIRQEFYADYIISGVGAWVTYKQLLPRRFSLDFKKEIDRFPSGSTHVCVYIGFKKSPECLGFKGENCWIYDDYDHDKNYSGRGNVLNGQINSCFLSFPSLKDPMARSHTAELIAFVDHENFAKWSDTRWGKRGKDYEKLKQGIADGLIDFVEGHYPGFAGLIDYCELSTPLSTANFTGHKDGCIYGLPGIPDKLRARWLTPRTPVRNLYLTGSDIAGHGIVGALMGGVLTLLVASRQRYAILRLLYSAMRLSRHPEKRDVLLESQTVG